MPKIKLRYYCCYSDQLEDALKEKRISYKIISDDFNKREHIIFTIYDTKPHDEKFENIIKLLQITCVRSLIFTKKEMDSAEWFLMWCDNMKIEEKSGTSAFLYTCKYGKNRAYHRKQIRPYTLNKNIKWNNNRNFIAEIGDGSPLFTNARTKHAFEENGFMDIEYMPVYQPNKKEHDDFFQFIPKHTLPNESLVLRESDNCKKFTCKLCGAEQFRIDGSFQFKIYRSFLKENWNIVKTEEIFGQGFPYSVMFISKKMYDFMHEKKLNRNLHFEPIEIIED